MELMTLPLGGWMAAAMTFWPAVYTTAMTIVRYLAKTGPFPVR
jgi:hypothetical protein